MSDQNKGPIYGVDLPEELPIGVIGISWVQVVPRRDELELVRKKVGDRTVAALEVALRTCKRLSDDLLSVHAAQSNAWNQLLKRSGFDISPCRTCGASVVCIPEGFAVCETCAAKGGEA